MRLAGVALVAIVVAFPLATLPAAPVTWLAGAALVVGVLGVSALSVPLAAAGAAIAMVAYALAIVIGQPPADPSASAAFGATLVLLLALVHFAGRIHGAAVGPGVVAGQVRHWLGVGAAGVLAALGISLGGAALGPLLLGATLPIVIVAAALGAVLTAAGVIALVTSGDRA
jgi:hypothetical protein